MDARLQSWLGAPAALLVLLLATAAFSADVDAADYVGDAVCLACHEALQEGFGEHYSRTVHAKVLTPQNARNELMGRGCEACHGPGSAHVGAGGGNGVGGMLSFDGTSPEAVLAQDTACLQCHQGGTRRFWVGGVHSTRDVGCTSCHTVMRNVSQRSQLSGATEVSTCGECHPIQNARQYRNAHMPLRSGAFQSSTAVDGKMSCGSCHNPHGTVGEHLIAHNSTRDSCLSCHADKRGPFLWEHAPVTEDCLNCHDPHGTTRASMLKLGVPRLCTSCHGSGHAGSPRTADDRFVVGTSCLQCHGQVHGTNHPSGRRLLR
jgi:DmsE family decaheme c-type cytochrome